MGKITILHLSSYKEDCGIAKYLEQFVDAMIDQKDIENVIFPISPYVTRRLDQKGKNKVVRDFLIVAGSVDIVHIQHEFGFYDGNELEQIMNGLRQMGKKVIITMHTSPTYAYKEVVRQGFGPKSILRYVIDLRAKKQFMSLRFEPVKKADYIIVHNNATKADLEQYGVNASSIVVMRHPVQRTKTTEQTTEISDNLHKQKGDVIYAALGFPSTRKGAYDVIRALTFLPDNYKLAIIGGVHPTGENEVLIDKMCDLAVKLGVESRLYITGLVKDDAKFNSLIQEADICVYPYIKKYYDHVSSGALNHAVANNKPVLAYPTQSFIEMNADGIPVVQLTKSFNYYELARSLQSLDVKAATKASMEYAARFKWANEAKHLADLYRQVA